MRKALPSMFLVATLAACSHGPTMSAEDRVALYRQHAGEPVASITLPGTGMRQWTPLDDQVLAVWATPTTGHLVELRNPCPRMSSSPRLAFTNSMGTVTAGMDSVVTRGATGSVAGVNACRIETIRPLDGNAIREAKREMREYEAIERSEAPPE
ncbi:DUF6491 family protein [Lysobacter sp. A6]|uniref:DUF6491 family protein n=1 Tax=Noviluteimonas lactosilytica TaxID=2888523 RepID=A0ABS8JEQ8_9GAMM|nr:DUF6491 family protein [Lysobacter lactosilyticus]MCC8361995.1 DUF6491 family protein [Lysobacter lactosilyticus]